MYLIGVNQPKVKPIPNPPKWAKLFILAPGKNPQITFIKIIGSRAVPVTGLNIVGVSCLNPAPKSSPINPNIAPDAPTEIALGKNKWVKRLPKIPDNMYIEINLSFP